MSLRVRPAVSLELYYFIFNEKFTYDNLILFLQTVGKGQSTFLMFYYFTLICVFGKQSDLFLLRIAEFIFLISFMALFYFKCFLPPLCGGRLTF